MDHLRFTPPCRWPRLGTETPDSRSYTSSATLAFMDLLAIGAGLLVTSRAGTKPYCARFRVETAHPLNVRTLFASYSSILSNVVNWSPLSCIV